MSQIISTDGHGERVVQDMAICKAVFERLQEHYPGHQWLVGADTENAGTVHVRLLYVNPLRPRDANFGYLLHLDSLNDENSFRHKVLTAGGELLERYGLPRRGYREGDGMRALEHGLDRG